MSVEGPTYSPRSSDRTPRSPSGMACTVLKASCKEGAPSDTWAWVVYGIAWDPVGDLFPWLEPGLCHVVRANHRRIRLLFSASQFGQALSGVGT